MPKKENVRAMFNEIAPTYDKLNHTLSLNIDKIWRRKAVRRLIRNNPQTVIDIACGTGDSSIALAKAGVPRIVGLDISEGMLGIAEQKVAKTNYDIHFQLADALNLPFNDNSIDAVMIAFGVRNFENRSECLKEILRVLKPGGVLLILELSVPQNILLKSLYKVYFLHILPFIGKLVSGSKFAYNYLPHSVLNFPAPNAFMEIVRNCGYNKVIHKALTFGLCRIFEAVK